MQDLATPRKAKQNLIKAQFKIIEQQRSKQTP